MRVSVLGLGYVGSVTAACLASFGHDVVGVDVNEAKMAAIRGGQSPVIEDGLDELIAEGVSGQRLSVTTDVKRAIACTDVSMICVGTPSSPVGALNIDAVVRVCEEIGVALREKAGYHVVVVRSTVLPGTVREHVIPALERSSGMRAGEGFGVAVNPEFLREGTAIRDFHDSELTIIGELDPTSGDVVERLFVGIDAPVRRVALEVAELTKYASNAFHALKVTFANEIGALSKQHGIDGRGVMDLLRQDHRLNISPAYLSPGFAFGGSCLPKDTRALAYRSRQLDMDTPLLSSILPSNERHLQRGIELVERQGKKKIGVLGLAFKEGTDDVRESPMVPFVETLVGRGYDVKVFDEMVVRSQLVGANKTFLEEAFPHVAVRVTADLDELLAESEVLVVASGGRHIRDAVARARESQVVVDLVGIPLQGRGGAYEGICW